MKKFSEIKQRTAFTISLNIFLFAVLLILVVLAMCVGKYPVTPSQTMEILFCEIFGKTGEYTQMARNVVIGLRLPRIIASIICGVALSVSGATYQGIFKNPLVAPDFLGVSSGACIGAAAAILLSLSGIAMQGMAFLGGIIAVLLTVLIPYAMRSKSNITLVLSGIIVSGLMSSVLGFIKYVADPETELAAITFWTMGSFSYVTLKDILSILPTIVIPLSVLLAMSWWIDILSLGENEAKSLGANVTFIRNLAIFCATLITASSVCLSGTIGWVGLVIPHFARLLVGPGNTRLIPTAALVGGIFMLLVDTVTRTISIGEMPVSILTGVIGAPFYAYLLYRQRSSTE